jgi:SAM-dependent methyltransferase
VSRVTPKLYRLMARTTWHPDKWERLSLMADHVGTGATSVLDLGGRGHEMAGLLAPVPVVSANVQEPADVIVPVGQLPFDDDAFDVITCCDVLEHMAAEFRPTFIAQLLRVARRRVVLCCPWGSPEKDASELRLQAMLADELGVHLEFLDEHIEFGLPTEVDVRAMILDAVPTAKITTLYQEDFEDGEALLMDGMRARYKHDPMALLRYLRRGYFGRRRPELKKTSSPDSHRLFVIVELDG